MGIGSTISTTSTLFAQRIAPPPREPKNSVMMGTGCLGGIAGLFVGAVIDSPLLVILLSIGGFFGAATYVANKGKDQNVFPAFCQWKNSWVCMSCGHIERPTLD